MDLRSLWLILRSILIKFCRYKMPFTSLEDCAVRCYDDLVKFVRTIKSKGRVSINNMPEEGQAPNVRARYKNFGVSIKYTVKGGRNMKNKLEEIIIDRGWTYTPQGFTRQKSNVIIADAENCMCGNVVEETYTGIPREILEKLIDDYVDDMRRGYCRMNEFRTQLENRPWGLDSGTNAAEAVYSVVVDIQSHIRWAMGCIEDNFSRHHTPGQIFKKITKIPRARGVDFGYKQDLCATCNEVTV